MAPAKRTLYQHVVGEDTVVQLGSLCPNCRRFKEASALLRKWSSRESIPIGETERYELCSPEQLRDGYLSGCHLCALLWMRAGGILFDPAEPVLTLMLQRVVVQLEARNMNQAYHAKRGRETYQPPRKRPTSPLGDRGVVAMWLPVVEEYQSRYPTEDNSLWHELYVYLASNTEINQYGINAPTSQPISTRNVQSLDQLHAWYRSCRHSHSKCNGLSSFVAPTNQLPSRLLDLQGDKVRLECAVEHLPPDVEYTTLSHMWGPDPSAVLTLVKDKVSEFQVDIPGALLPDKYKEAIRVARSLGFRYLWIDSLCIIQDSPEDWQREALKMAAVYGRSRCNISYAYPPVVPGAAASAPGGPDEKKYLRDPRLYVPCRLQWAKNRLPSSSSPPAADQDLIVQDSPAGVHNHWSTKTFLRRWPLLSRAWVFQERLLCPRTVYCGDSRLVWECCEAQEDEFYGTATYSPRSKQHFYAVFSGLVEQHPRPDLDESGQLASTFQIEWPLLVQDYRCGDLTYETDRAMAFAGIARAIQTHTSFTYLAGIWKELADTGLLWTVCPPPPSRADEFRSKLKVLQGLQQKQPPSWSWFSVPVCQLAPGSDVLDFQTYTTLVDPRCAPVQAGGRRYRARVVDFHHPDLPMNSGALLHDFHGLRMTLCTRRIRATLAWGSMGRVSRLQLRPSDRPLDTLIYSHDDVLLMPGTPPPKDVCMVLTILQMWREPDNNDDDDDGGDETRMDAQGSSAGEPKMKNIWQYAGLCIIPAEKAATGEACWRRIGVFYSFDEGPGNGQAATMPFDVDTGTDENVVLV